MVDISLSSRRWWPCSSRSTAPTFTARGNPCTSSTQRQVMGIRPYMTACWDMVSRWESAEPTEHRVPISFAIVEALLAVALGWQWFQFAGTLGLIFFGIARPGEVLRSTRCLLVLPRDLLSSTFDVCYLTIENPKGRRGSSL